MDSQTREGRPRFDQPCAACRLLHRRCSADCLLAPHFPASDPDKFARVHKVFGASNVIKMLQTVEEADREDAVKGLVYEACARIRDPVYGSTGAVVYLLDYVKDLEQQLETTRAQILEYRLQRDKLLNALLPVYNPVIDDYMMLDVDASSSLDKNARVGEPIQFSSNSCQIV